jgi:hypothetical protein
MDLASTALDRRTFLKSVAALGMFGAERATAAESQAQALPAVTDRTDDRSYWIGAMERIATPVLENLSRRELRKVMPVEAANPADRGRFTHLEAFGRVLSGIAPWLAVQGLDESEALRRHNFVEWAQDSLDAATDPGSPDFMNFHEDRQPLVDAAFMAQGILRAPAVLWEPLSARVRGQVVAALKSSRAIPTPTSNNWVMFAAMVEAALHTMGQQSDADRCEGCVQRMLGWYKGDGAYGDGENFHFDYYNSFVIHPMLLDVVAVLRREGGEYGPVYGTVLNRARRHAEILEQLIAPDGTFPSVGRSTAYRFGAFHALAQIALMRELPERLMPAQVRCAMTAVIRRMIEAPGTFDDRGWLRIGFWSR